MPTADDGTALLPRVASGDAAAVRQCITAFGSLLFTLAMRMLGNRTDAEDVVQEIFIDLWKSAGRYDPGMGSEVTFVTMIARRRLIDRRRRMKPTASLEADLIDHRIPTDGIDMSDEANLVRQAMTRLSDVQQNVLRMVVDGGLTQSEIAERLNLPLGTVKTHLRRGLLSVREQFGIQGREQVPGNLERLPPTATDRGGSP